MQLKILTLSCPQMLDYQLQQLGPPFVAPLIHRAQHPDLRKKIHQIMPHFSMPRIPLIDR
jgi:hypothetical protein